MPREPKEIEGAFRRVQWAAFTLDLKRSWAAWALLVALIAALFYLFASPMHVVATAHGTAVGAHLPPSDDNSPLMQVSARLDDGAMVVVAFPRGTLYRAGAGIEIAVVRRDWPPHLTTYRFIRYVD